MWPALGSNKNVLDTKIVWIYIRCLPSLPFLEIPPAFLFL